MTWSASPHISSPKAQAVWRSPRTIPGTALPGRRWAAAAASNAASGPSWSKRRATRLRGGAPHSGAAPGKGGGTMRWWENPNPKPWVLHGFTFKSGARNGSWPRAYLSLVWGTICCANLRATKTSKDTQLQWKMPTALQMARLKTGKNHPASCIMVAPWKFQGATMSGMMTRNKGRNPDSPIKKKKRPKFKRFRMQHGFVWKSRGKPLNPSVSFIIFPMKLVIWNYLEAYQAYFLFRHTVPNLGYAGHRSCRKKMTGEG